MSLLPRFRFFFGVKLPFIFAWYDIQSSAYSRMWPEQYPSAKAMLPGAIERSHMYKTTGAAKTQISGQAGMAELTEDQ